MGKLYAANRVVSAENTIKNGVVEIEKRDCIHNMAWRNHLCKGNRTWTAGFQRQ